MSDATETASAATATVATAPGRLRWWKEVLYAGAFYLVYSFIRNRFGSAAVSPSHAFGNARLVVDVERALGLFLEPHVQSAFLGWVHFIRFWNVFYGTFHFIVTAVALIVLFRRQKDRYPLWRNTLAFTTGVALVGFALFPLMPPRLLNEGGPYGGAEYATEDYHIVDTLADVGGLWSFDSGTMKSISNQYAAMPSLHCAWALWCTLVLVPMTRRRWLRALEIAYPALTVFAIVVTGNHYWIDAAGGALVLGVGFLLARRFTAWTDARWARRHAGAAA